jgi:serine/threonine protein kinase
MPVQPPVLEEGTEVSRYRVQTLVARGGMGLVYRARDLRLDRPVALKVLSPELSDDERFRERFVRESRLAAAVDHPNVIPVYEADDWHGLLYLAMRFVDGVDLHTVLATGGRMEPAAALPILTQAAEALDAAHRLGLVHRDVKPGNFMLAGASADHVPPGTHVYLTDFGLTKRATSVSGLTRTGQFLGSLHYVAPEQIKGEDVDARTDIYALACVAFEMLAGRPPFDPEGEAGLLWAHMSEPPPALTAVRPDLPPSVDDVLARAMAKERADRPATCAEFVSALRWALTRATAPVATPTHVGGSHPGGPAGPATAPPHFGQHPSFPPGTAPETVQQGRQPTPVQLPVWAPAGGAGTPPRRWGRRTTLLVALGAVVVLLAAALLVWRPWAGPDLAARDLVVVPYRAEVPEEWQQVTETVDATFTVLGPQDWSGLIAGEEAVVADAENALEDDPASLVQMYVDPSDYVSAETPADAASQLQGYLPYGGRLVEQGTRDVAEREGLEVGGLVPLGESGQLRVYAVAVSEEPRMLMIFLCPPSLYDEWRPVFDAVVDSVEYTG